MKKLKYTFYIVLIIVVFLLMSIKKNTIENSIVFIEALNNEYLSKGMGFVYKVENDTNYIVTNYHVIHDSENIYVYNLNDKKIKAEILDFDKYTDIAILKIKDELNLKESKINRTSIKEKDDIYYFNLDSNKVDKGKALNLNTEIFIDSNYGISYYEGISIKGNIIKGNSGGPILNKNNEVIGLIALKEENKDIAICLPIDKIENMVIKLENHNVKRPNLGGVFVSSYNIEVLKENSLVVDNIDGVVVLEVMQDYPLHQAEITKGDIIIKINNIKINSANELQKEIYSYNIGDKITLEYYRNGELNKVDIILDK